MTGGSAMSAARLWQSFCEYWQAGGPLIVLTAFMIFVPLHYAERIVSIFVS